MKIKAGSSLWLVGLLFGLLVMLPSAHGQDEGIPRDAYVYPLGVPGTGYEALEPGVRGGAFHYAIMGDPATFNIEIARETVSSNIASRILNSNGGLIGDHLLTGEVDSSGLAKSWEFLDEDRTELVLHLRKGVKWNDGEEFTADDVVFTFKYIYKNPDCDVDYDPGDVLVEKIDDHTVKFTRSSYFRPFLDGLSITIYPEHVMGEHIRRYTVAKGLPAVPAGTFNTTWGLDVEASELVGLGPYRLKEYVPGSRITLERNPYYWKYDPNGTQLPYYDEVVIHIVGSRSDETRMFLDDEIDVLSTGVTPYVERQAERKGFTVLTGDKPGFGVSHLAFNQDTPDPALRAVFRDSRFRRAVAHAMDKESMIDEVLHVPAVPQWGPISMPSPFYNPEYDVVYDFDLEKSGNLLDEMGLVDTNGNGIRNITDDFLRAVGVSLSSLPREDERELEFELSTNAGSDVREEIICLLQRDLEEIGVRVIPKSISFQTLVKQLSGGTLPGGVVIAFTGGIDPDDSRNVYTSCGSLHFWRYTACEDPSETDKRVDELFELGWSVPEEEAKPYYWEFHRIMGEELHLIYTVASLFRYAYYDYVGNAEGASAISSPSGTNGGFQPLVYDKRLAEETE